MRGSNPTELLALEDLHIIRDPNQPVKGAHSVIITFSINNRIVLVYRQNESRSNLFGNGFDEYPCNGRWSCY